MKTLLHTLSTGTDGPILLPGPSDAQLAAATALAVAAILVGSALVGLISLAHRLPIAES